MRSQEEHRPLSGGLILLLAIGCGVSVANLYYNQPLLDDIARTFHARPQHVGVVSMCTQIGYAVGMFIFVPLGDIRERRKLIVVLSLIVSAFLALVATARSLLWLDAASLAVGMTTVAPQLMVPLAAHLAPPAKRGRVIGTVMSGLLIGILLARTFAGFVGHALGWRAMYWIAAGMMLALGIIVRFALPTDPSRSSLTVRGILRSLGQLVATQRTVREAALMSAMFFGGFSVFWTTLAFLLAGAPFHMGSQVAGLFGLVGVIGASIAPVAGRLADRFPASILVGGAGICTLLSFGLFWRFGHNLWGLVCGVVLLDAGVQGAQILNQTRIYSLVPDARSRLNTIYMVTSFVGGAVGSFLGTNAWARWGWTGVCGVGGAMVGCGLIVWMWGRMRDRLTMLRTDEMYSAEK